MQDFQDVRKKSRFYEKLLRNMNESGFTTPTPIQGQTVPLLLQRRDVLAVAPTGPSPGLLTNLIEVRVVVPAALVCIILHGTGTT